MRNVQRVIAALTLALLMSVVAPPSSADVSFDLFYSDLGPHGSWLASAQHGRVWQPSIYQPEWNPYYDGHWEYADVGWTWVSDYSWGAIPYHYGTWLVDPVLGWVWAPGTTWAPAWVVFRTGPDYIGWAPVAPSFTVGVSVGVSALDSGPFVFVSARDFCASKIRGYVVPESVSSTMAAKTTIVNSLVVQNNIVVNRGPDVSVVERASERKIRVAELERVPRVAPFAEVQRQQMAIAPERMRKPLRATEPVPADRPLPSSSSVAQLSRESAPVGQREPRASTEGSPKKPVKKPKRQEQPKKDDGEQPGMRTRAQGRKRRVSPQGRPHRW